MDDLDAPGSINALRIVRFWLLVDAMRRDKAAQGPMAVRKRLRLLDHAS